MSISRNGLSHCSGNKRPYTLAIKAGNASVEKIAYVAAYIYPVIWKRSGQENVDKKTAGQPNYTFPSIRPKRGSVAFASLISVDVISFLYDEEAN